MTHTGEGIARQSIVASPGPIRDGITERGASMTYTSNWMDDELTAFRDTVSRFVETEMVPHEARWRAQHHVDREIWRLMGQTGLLCLDVPEEYGGVGGDFRHEAVVYEELCRSG